MTLATDRIDQIYRSESGRVLATLIRLLGDFDLAEEALQDAFTAAVERWPAQGIPENPRTWLVSTGRFKAIDRLRRQARLREKTRQLLVEVEAQPVTLEEAGDIPDDRLRLIFTCCHPALAPEIRIALTLRTICGLTTEEIGRAFLVPLPTMAQRLVRAKSKIRSAGIPYEIPPAEHLGERLESVLTVIYLVFTEGYAATTGDTLIRRDLCAEAIRLARVLAELLPEAREVRALLALLLLHDARREARMSPEGEIVLLDDQDRSRWDRERIGEGLALIHGVLKEGQAGYYALQAAIAALHAEAPSAAETDWRQIAAIYALLRTRNPSPVIELNHAVAVAMVDGPERGLRLLDALEARGQLRGYHLLPAARAELMRRSGKLNDAAKYYRQALGWVTHEVERKFLEMRLRQVECSEPSQSRP